MIRHELTVNNRVEYVAAVLLEDELFTTTDDHPRTAVNMVVRRGNRRYVRRVDLDGTRYASFVRIVLNDHCVGWLTGCAFTAYKRRLTTFEQLLVNRVTLLLTGL